MGLFAAIKQRMQGKGRPSNDELLEVEGEDDYSTGEHDRRGDTIEDAYRRDGENLRPDAGGEVI